MVKKNPVGGEKQTDLAFRFGFLNLQNTNTKSLNANHCFIITLQHHFKVQLSMMFVCDDATFVRAKRKPYL